VRSWRRRCDSRPAKKEELLLFSPPLSLPKEENELETALKNREGLILIRP